MKDKIEQQRLRDILGKPEGRSLSCADYFYCIAISIKVFISFVISKIIHIFVVESNN